MTDILIAWITHLHKRAAHLQEDAGVTGVENDCVHTGLYIHV